MLTIMFRTLKITNPRERGGQRPVIAMPAFAFVYLLNHEQTALKIDVVSCIIQAFNLTSSIGKFVLLKNAPTLEKVIAGLLVAKEVVSTVLLSNDLKNWIKATEPEKGKKFLDFWEYLEGFDITRSTTLSTIDVITKKEWFDALYNNWSLLIADSKNFTEKIGKENLAKITNALESLKKTIREWRHRLLVGLEDLL